MIVTALLVRWTEGWHEVINPAAIAKMGRKEGLLGLGAVSTLSEVDTVSKEQLNYFADPLTEIGADVFPVGTTDAPFVGYRTGDSIVVPDLPGKSPSSQRVQAITATMDDDGRVTYAVELNDVLLDERERFAETITKMANGTLGGWSKVGQPTSYTAEAPPSNPYPPAESPGAGFTVAATASYDAYDSSELVRSVPPGDGTYRLTSFWCRPETSGPRDGLPLDVELWQVVPGGDGSYSAAVVHMGQNYQAGIEYDALITDNTILFEPEWGMQFHIYGDRTGPVFALAEFEGGGEQVTIGWPGPTLRISHRPLNDEPETTT